MILGAKKAGNGNRFKDFGGKEDKSKVRWWT